MKKTNSERFWERVASHPSGCWVWTRTIVDGYGLFWADGATISAHRYAYLEMVGEIPAGLELDHLCRNRACVNPFHLDPVTHAVNMRRSPLLGSGNGLKTHCKHGHEFTPENTSVQQQSGGRGLGRKCRSCDRARASNKRSAMRGTN